MADWPTLTLLKQTLGVDRDDKDTLLEQALGAAIEGVVNDCGGDPVEVSFSGGSPTVSLVDASPAEDYVPVEIDVTSKLAQAALHRAVTVYKGPEAPFGVAGIFDTGGIYVSRRDPTYMWLIKGHRERFGIA
jgi:hypothetical protein